MPYARTNWDLPELLALLANPVSAAAGPHAHALIHAVSGELANHPLFQRARVTALITTGNATSSNAPYHAKNANGSWVYSNNQRKQHPLPGPDATKHSTLDVSHVAAAMKNALNSPAMQPHLLTLDGGTDMKVHVNFTATIGRGRLHTEAASTDTDFCSLFVYCKPNPGNKDLPVFQTVVPAAAHKVGGNDPIILI